MPDYTMYCHEDGKIGIDKECPKWTLPLASGPKKRLSAIMSVLARTGPTDRKGVPYYYLVPRFKGSKTYKEKLEAARIFKEEVLVRLRQAKAGGYLK